MSEHKILAYALVHIENKIEYIKQTMTTSNSVELESELEVLQNEHQYISAKFA